MDKGSALGPDSSDSDQQLPIMGPGALYMEYARWSNQLVLIVDETSLDSLDGEVLSNVAQLVEQGIPPSFKEQILDRWLPPPFVQCECYGV